LPSAAVCRFHKASMRRARDQAGACGRGRDAGRLRLGGERS
jgi:hypothetical protein